MKKLAKLTVITVLLLFGAGCGGSQSNTAPPDSSPGDMALCEKAMVATSGLSQAPNQFMKGVLYGTYCKSP